MISKTYKMKKLSIETSNKHQIIIARMDKALCNWFKFDSKLIEDMEFYPDREDVRFYYSDFVTTDGISYTQIYDTNTDCSYLVETVGKPHDYYDYEKSVALINHYIRTKS